MGLIDELNERKKKQVTTANTSSSGGLMAELYLRQKYNSSDTSSVNNDFINSFISDANNFFSNAEKSYSDIGYSNASSTYDTVKNSWKDLNTRRDTILAWLYKNKDHVNEETYNSVSKSLNSFNSDAQSIISSFEKALNEYSQFETEDAYNEYYNRYAKYGELSNTADATTGWEKYLTDVEISKQAAEAEKENETWYEAIGRYLFGSGGSGTADSTLPTSNISVVTNAAREDDSHTKPQENWTEEQKKVFGALYSSNPSEAYEYAIYTNSLNAKTAEAEKIKKIQETATSDFWSGLGHTLGAIVTAPLGLADSLNDLAYANAGRPTPSDGIVSPFEYSQSVIGGISSHLNTEYGTLDKDIPVFGGKGWGDVYGLGTSIAQSMASAYTLGGTGTLVSYFGQGAAAGVDDALARGASDDQAILYGTALGVFEGLAEKIGVDNLFKLGSSSTVKGFIKNILKQAGAEGAEEGLTSLLSNIADNVIMQDKSNFNALVAQYMAQGMSESDAKTNAWLDSVGGIAFDTIAGAASGGISGGIHTTAQTIDYNQQVKKHGQSIIDQGGTDTLKALALDVAGVNQSKEGQKITKLASKVDSKTSAKNVGKLSTQLQDSIGVQNKADIQAALVEKGLNEKDATRVAEYLAGKAKLTSKQKAEIEGNENIKAVVAELLSNPDSAINERARNLIYARLGHKTSNTASTATNSGKMSVKNEIDVTDKIFESGKTTQASTGKEITIDKNNAIKKIEVVDGKRIVYLNTDHGVVKSSDISYANKDEALIYESFVDMNPAFANAVIKNYNGSVPIQTYINGMREGIVIYGMHNFQAVGKDISKDSYLAQLSEVDQSFALKLGRNYAKADAKKAEAPLRKAIKNAAEKAASGEKTSTDTKAKKGKVYFENGAKALMKHKKTVTLAKHLANAIGINIAFYDATIAGTKHSDSNGYYDPATNTIHLDLQNAKDDAKTIAFTLSHELVHFIKDKSPTQFNTFANFLMEQYAEHGVNTSTLLSNKMAELGTKDADYAYEEMIADACETLLLDSNAVYKLMELRKNDLNLFETIKLHIHELLSKIRAEYKKLGLQPTSDEAKALLKMEDVLEQIYAKFEDALVEATQNYQATIGMRNLEDFATAETTDGKTLFQYKAIKADENTYRDMLKKWGKMSEAQINNLFTTIDTAVDLIKDNLEALDYAWEADIDDRAFSPVKPNSDKLYQVSLDFSTLCRKRILQQTVATQLQEALNKPLTREEGIAIRDALIALQEEGRQIEVACALCYVESARMKSPDQIKRFIDNKEAVIREFFAGKSGGDIKSKIKKAEDDAREKLHKENPNGIKGKDGATMLDPRTAALKALPKKYADTIREAKRTAKQSYTPSTEEQKIIEVAKDMTVSDFTSPEGLENLAKNYPSLFDAYTSYIRNATKSKGIENDTWWRAGDSTQIGDVLIANMNKENGLRSQSWSDFQVVHILDYIASTIELATRETKEQAYSKVPDYVELMGNTGVMINMSLIPTAKFNGTLDYDSVEGIDYKKALELRDKYHATAGTICIGVDNVQIKLLLEDITIDYVIPYHKSGMSADIRKLMHIPSWSQYEEYQSEKNLSRADAEKQAKKYGVTLLTESDPNYHKGTSFSEWFDLKEAQQIAKIENANPSDKAKHKKYGVMYGGYMAMQNAANNYLKLCVERGLAPKFSHEKADFTSEDNYWKLLIDRKMVDNVTGEVIEQQTIKPIFDEAEVMRILNDELERYPNVKADQDYAIRKVVEGYLSGNLKGGMSAEAIAKVIKKPVDNVTNVNILASAENDTDSGIKKQVKKAATIDLSDNNELSKLVDGVHGSKRYKAIAEYIINVLGNEEITLSDGTVAIVDKRDAAHIASNAGSSKTRQIAKIKDLVTQAELYAYDNNAEHNKFDQFLYYQAMVRYADEEFPLYLNVGRGLNDKKYHIYDITKKIRDTANRTNGFLRPKPNEGYAIENDISNNSIPYSDSSVKKQLKKTSTNYAPTFYSQMGKVIDDIKMDKIGASSIVNYLKGKGIKNDEIKWSGIEYWLEGKKSVTKAELQEFVASSQLQIEEEMSDSVGLKIEKDGEDYIVKDKDGNIVDTWSKTHDPGDPNLVGWISEEEGQIASDINEIREYVSDWYEESDTRWSQYRLDGGTNYRELVFKMPKSSYSNQAMRSHWGEDAEGVLAHARIQDFEVDGKKMLFIEELQSDWHNEGLQTGYVDNQSETDIDKLKSVADEKFLAVEDYSVAATGLAGEWETIERTPRGAKLLREYHEAQDAYDNAMNEFVKKIPDAPFHNNYHEYVLKRLLRMAAEEGYDAIGWTPSQIQSDRWSDEFAEAYRIEYDQEMPKFLRKYGKKWGATVGKSAIAKETVQGRERLLKETELENVKRDIESAKRELARKYDSYEKAVLQRSIDSMEKTVATLEQELSASLSVWSMDITEPMEQSVLYEGQAKFQKKKLSNRTILANTLENTIDTSTQAGQSELKWLKDYQSKIALIEKEEAHLAEINAEIKEISFTKGSDRSKLKGLNEEKTRTANRINTYDKQLMRLEAMKPIKDVLAREKELVRKRTEEKGREMLKSVRERDAKTLREVMNRNQESRKKAIDSRHRTEMRHKIHKIVSELNQLLLNPTKEKHVPIGLQKPVSEALAVINMDTVGAEERIAKYDALIAKATDPDKIKALKKSRDNIELQGESLKDRLEALKNAYADFEKSDDPLIRNAHNEAIENLIENTADKIGNTPIRSMSYEQLESVYDMFKAIRATVRNANKMFKEGRQETVSENSSNVAEEIRQVGGHRNRELKALKAFKKYGWNMFKPITAMKVIGSNTFERLFSNVRAGEDTWAVDVSEAKEFFRDKAKQYDYWSWDFKKQYSFKDGTNRDFSLSLEQIMSLYAYSKRSQADKHLEIGGFVFDDAIEVTEKKHGIPLKYTVNDANPYRLTKDGIAEVISALTEEQKQFLDEMQTYLSDVMGAKGNEVSLAMYDIKLYNEKNYFPLKTARHFREFNAEQSATPNLKNSGFSKKTVPQAGNPIVLSNFMDVWSSHVNDMSMYHAFVLPLEDFMRVYNYSSTAGGYDSVQQYIKNAYGSQANTYIETLLKDLNGGARVDPSADLVNKGISLFKKASVFASASVVVQQPSAMARAMAYINPKYFATTPHIKDHKAEWAELKKYAPIAIIKEMGYFDTNVGKKTTDWITEREYEGIAQKSKAVFTDSGYRDELLSKAPAMADELSWTYIWEAVKKETKATTKLEGEELLKQAGQRFTEVIANTQVYDSVLSRSAMMRSKDTGMKMATAFMAEPTTVVNMMVDGIIQAKRGKKKFLASTIGAVSASIILNSILVSLVYAARDDDEDETYPEKYLESLTAEFIDGFNPITYLPFAKDIWSIAQGYDVERSDMSVWSKLVESIESLFSETKSGWEKTEEVVGAISSLFGLPFKNILRDARGIYNLASTLSSGTETTSQGISDAVEDAAKSSVPFWNRIEKLVGADESKSDKLYEAIMSGDQTHINRVKAQYATDQALTSAIRTALRENDTRIHEAAQARYNGDIETYKRIAKAIIAEGRFSQDDVVAAINADMNAIKKSETFAEDQSDDTAEEATSIYKASDINSAFDNGDDALALEIINDLISTKVAGGMDEKKAKSSIRSSMTSYWKPLYKEAYQNGDANEMKRIRYILFNSGLYGNGNEVVKTVQDWLKD